MPDVRPTRLRRSPPRPTTPFGRLAMTHGAVLASEAFVTIALAGTLFFTVSPGAARPRVALFLLFTMAPFAVVAPVLGPLMDRTRHGRRFFVVLTCVGRAVLAWLMAGHRNSLLLFPEAFGVLVLSKGYAVAKSSIVPAVVDDGRGETLVQANSRLALVGVISGFVGGGMAAGILQLGGGAWVLRTATVLYVGAAVAALRLPKAVAVSAGPLELERAELRRPTILLSATAMAMIRASVGFLTFFLAFTLKRAGEPAWVYGLVIAGSAVGGFIGAVTTPLIRRRIREEAIITGAMLLPAVVALFAARDPTRVMATLMAVSLGFGTSGGKLSFDSLVQRDAPDADRSKAFARFETRFQLAWVVGAFLPVMVPLPERLGFLAIAAALGFFGLSYVGSVRGAAHEDPAGGVDAVPPVRGDAAAVDPTAPGTGPPPLPPRRFRARRTRPS